MKKAMYILGSLEDSDVEWMTSVGRRETHPPGEALITEGQHSGKLFIVLDGKLEVSTSEVRLAEVGRGEILGEVALVDSRPPMATVKTAVETAVLCISFSDLHAKLRSDVPFAARLYRAIAVFLAHRYRTSQLQKVDGGKMSLDEDEEFSDEIDPDVLDEVTLAGARFNWMIEQLRGT